MPMPRSSRKRPPRDCRSHQSSALIWMAKSTEPLKLARAGVQLMTTITAQEK